MRVILRGGWSAQRAGIANVEIARVTGLSVSMIRVVLRAS
jgi:hypothetical protein